MKPLYTSANCKAAFQLRWSLALFSSVDLPSAETWAARLEASVERDGVRILDHQQQDRQLLFLISTEPPIAPPQIVKSVKGRLQHILKGVAPKAFRRNFSLVSVGEARRDAAEAYVASQLDHHPLADKRVQTRFTDFQFVFPDINPCVEQFSSHGRYAYAIHLVLVNEKRWREIREEELVITRDMFFRVARKKDHLLSRLAILPDHMHATLGCRFDESPEETALCYMNNLAFAHGMKSIFCNSYYIGTIGEYDMDAIRRSLRSSGSVVAGSQ